MHNNDVIITMINPLNISPLDNIQASSTPEGLAISKIQYPIHIQHMTLKGELLFSIRCSDKGPYEWIVILRLLRIGYP